MALDKMKGTDYTFIFSILALLIGLCCIGLDVIINGDIGQILTYVGAGWIFAAVLGATILKFL